LIQNMAVYICPKCGHEDHIFGRDGVHREAAKLGTIVLGDVPLHADICTQADIGRPTVVDQPDGKLAKYYFSISDKIMAGLEEN
jgi:ATP-binding protein involved in chromosome partitioning